MSERPDDAFDARMRRLLAGVDTAPGFESRVARRIAELPAVSRETLRERAERRRALDARRLRKEAWATGASTAGIGAAGLVLILRHRDAIARWAEASADIASDPLLAMAFMLAVVATAAWPALRR